MNDKMNDKINQGANMLEQDMNRAKKTVEKHSGYLQINNELIPSFSTLEFNICGICNRRCSFCPRVDPNAFPNIKEYLTLELYKKIMNDLKAIDASPRIVYSGFSEPLIHPKLKDLISATKEIRPEAKLEIKTNGDLLNTEKLNEYFKRGLDYILISLYDGPGTEKEFEQMRDEAGLTPEQVMLRVRYWTEKYGHNMNLSNRGGTVGGPFKDLLKIKEPMKQRCNYPSMMMMIDYNGDVLLCPHDWGKKLINKNLSNVSVLEAWTSQKLHAVRKSLNASDRNFAPCDVCNIDGTLTGQKNYEYWKEYYKNKGK